jgi:hypothetical protein
LPVLISSNQRWARATAFKSDRSTMAAERL